MIDCPVCLETLRDAVELGCGHSLCGGCLLRVAEVEVSAKCPTCRQEVAHQHPSYAQREICRRDSADQADIDRRLRRRFPPTRAQQNTAGARSRAPQQQQQQQQQSIDWTPVYLVLAIIYILSPIDAIPDFIPVLGQMDDTAIFLFICSKLWGYRR